MTSVPKSAVILRDQDCPYYKATFGAAGEHHAYALTVATRTKIGIAHQTTECHNGQIIAIQNGAQVGETIKMTCSTTQGVLTLDLPGDYTIDISLTDATTNAYTLKLTDVT